MIGGLKGWDLERSKGKAETGARGALLLALHYGALGDTKRLWSLLSKEKNGQTTAQRIVRMLTDTMHELAELHDPAHPLAPLRAQGYVFTHYESPVVGVVWSEINDAIERAERKHGRAEVWVEHHGLNPRKLAAWTDGRVLAFERHPVCKAYWRDCSKDVAEAIKNDERDLAKSIRERPPEWTELGGELPDLEQAPQGEAVVDEGLDRFLADASALEQEAKNSVSDVGEDVPPRQGRAEGAAETHRNEESAENQPYQAPSAEPLWDPAGLDRPEALTLARMASKCKPYVPRHNPIKSPLFCRICLNPIRSRKQFKKGEKVRLVRRMARASNEVVHDDCVLRVLEINKTKEVA